MTMAEVDDLCSRIIARCESDREREELNEWLASEARRAEILAAIESEVATGALFVKGGM